MPRWDVGKGTTKESYDAGRTGPTGGKGGSTFDTYVGGKKTGTDYGLMAEYGNQNQQIAANITLQQQAAAKERAIKEAFIQKSKRENVTKNPFTNFGAWSNKKRQEGIQKAIRRNKYSNLKELKALQQKSRFPGFIGTAIDAYNVDPETDMFDTESPREIAAQLSKTNSLTSTQSKAISDLQEDIAMENTRNISQDDFDEYMNRNKIVTSDGGGNPYILPQYAMMGGGADLGGEDVEEEETFEYHLGKGGQKTGKDVTDPRGYAANGGIMGLRARKAFGGIMDRVTGRRAYGLGSIFKKVTRAAKKVLSSDIGKMAIAGAAFYYGGGGMKAYNKGDGFWSGLGKMGGNFMSNKNPLLFSTKNIKGVDTQVFNPWKLAAMTVGTGAAMGPAKVDQLPGGNRGGSLIDPITGQPAKPAEMRASLNNALENAGGDPIRIKQINDAYAFLGPDERLGTYLPYQTYGVKDGGRIGYDLGGPAEIGEKNISDVLARVKELEDEGLDFGAAMSQAMKELSEGKAQGGRIGAEEGGLMDLGGMEKDYRAEGGFVPIGAKEKADDVPARLSVNEFVFTADAVRNAGGGDIDQGAEVMENVMKNLEAGGKISAETQGNTGAQEMFSVSERLGEVI